MKRLIIGWLLAMGDRLCDANFAAQLGSLAQFAQTAQQLGGAINGLKQAKAAIESRQNAQEVTEGNQLEGTTRGKFGSGQKFSGDGQRLAGDGGEGSGVRGFVDTLENLKDCDPETQGLCCIFKDYCDPNAWCSSDIQPDSLIDYINAVPRCVCKDGFEGSGVSKNDGCQNINECLQPGICQQECRDFAPGYACGCSPGYTLQSDGYSCEDIDECTEGTHTCAGTCVNTPGGYQCGCPAGYTLGADQQSCVDIDECALGLCQFPNFCENVGGGFACGCPPGYEPSAVDVSRCVDLDECASGVTVTSTMLSALGFRTTSSTSPIQTIAACNDATKNECYNAVGGYSCGCADGFAVQNSGRITPTSSAYDFVVTYRSSVDPLAPYVRYYDRGVYSMMVIETAEEIQNLVVSQAASVSEGSALTCADLDECSVARLSPLAFDACNSASSYSAVSNAVARLRSGSLDPSEAVDLPCDMGISSANPGLLAMPNDWSALFFQVADLPQLARSSQCLVVSEEARPAAVCVNDVGTFNCDCPEGFSYDWQTRRCEDVDECVTGQNECDGIEGMTCLNSLGSYTCECDEGYEKSPLYGTCVDVDECNGGTAVCSYQCVNRPGGFECLCPDGYELADDDATCIDVDECAMGVCPAPCLNTPGSYICGCPEGYADVGFLAGTSTGITWPASVVTNVQSMRPEELTPDVVEAVQNIAAEIMQTNCIDADECRFADVCPQGLLCSNTPGSFDCGCPAGFNLVKVTDATAGAAAVPQMALAAFDLNGQEVGMSTSPSPMRTATTPRIFGAWTGGAMPRLLTEEVPLWVTAHLKIDRLRQNDDYQCLDVNECTEGVGGADPCVTARPCCQNLEGSYECWKRQGLLSSRQCPVIEGVPTVSWTR